MKKLMIALLAVAAVSSQAHASFYGPLLTVRKAVGFAPMEHRTVVDCQIFPDKIVIKKGVYTAQITEVRETKLTGSGLFQLIDAAALLPVETRQGPSDIPYVKYAVIQILPNDAVKEIVLSETSNMIMTRKGSEARTLERFIDLACGL